MNTSGRIYLPNGVMFRVVQNSQCIFTNVTIVRDENGYDTCSLTYYKDDILLNDNDGTVIPDPERFFGDDWKDHFGDYEDDAVHFRNDEEGVDYEILKSDKTFAEVYRDEENEED